MFFSTDQDKILPYEFLLAEYYLQKQTNDLVAGTHGRGVIIIDDISILREVTPEIIRLRDVSDEDDSIDYLTFEREPNDGGSNSDLNALIETLTTDNWYVDLYLDDNEQDETCDYAGFVFEFAHRSALKAFFALLCTTYGRL